MYRKEFVALFKSKISKDSPRRSSALSLMLDNSVKEDKITSENQLDIKNKLATNLICCGIDISDSLVALKAFDDIAENIESQDKFKQRIKK